MSLAKIRAACASMSKRLAVKRSGLQVVVVVVECYCFLIIIIIVGQTRSGHLVCSYVLSRQNAWFAIWTSCIWAEAPNKSMTRQNRARCCCAFCRGRIAGFMSPLLGATGGYTTGNFASTELILSLKAKLLPRQNTHFECGIDFHAFCFCETPRRSGRWRRLAF